MVYLPLLNAFMDEIKRAYATDEELPRKLLEYIIGVEDSYKTVSHDNKRVTLIYKFNEHENLGIMEYMPTEIVAIKMKKDSENTAEIYLNNGWQLSFRIHNANSMVEPSLKFAIKFEGMPPSVLHLECRWS